MRNETLRKYIDSAIKLLFWIWFPFFIVNWIFSTNYLYVLGPAEFRLFVSLINEFSGNVISICGPLLYFLVLIWCVFNYKNIKEYVSSCLKTLTKNLHTGIPESRLEKQNKQESISPKSWFWYSSLFLLAMLFIDTYFYDYFVNFFAESTQSHAMPKRVTFVIMLFIIHNFRPIVFVLLLCSICTYCVFWIHEVYTKRKRQVG